MTSALASQAWHKKFFIDGAWVDPVSHVRGDVIDPATNEPIAEIAYGNAVDVERAVQAARRAFPSFSRTTPQERRALLQRIVEVYDPYAEDVAQLMTLEMGTPITFSREAQVVAGREHFVEMIRVLEHFPFEIRRGATKIVREAVGVCGLITPWNWPINQFVCKVAPALAAGCTIVLKPSEVSPLDALLFAEVLSQAGVPKGVFNLVNGDGASVGEAMSRHPQIDMMSFTGSTRAGIQVAKTSADTVKRVHQELGGKSPNIILADADLQLSVTRGVNNCYVNNGQSCDAPTRMFVPAHLHDEAAHYAKLAAEAFVVGSPSDPKTTLGPVAYAAQYHRIQGLIGRGIAEGATLVTGGLGLPQGINRGCFVRPTIFANVKHEMAVSREEIFGPVLAILPYSDVEQAVEEANDTVYGLAAYVQGKDMKVVRDIASRLRAGSIYINEPAGDLTVPFGGFKQSGNGREYSEWGLEAFVELKGMLNWGED